MKTANIEYDEITTKYNEEYFNHGFITYSNIQRPNNVNFLRLNVDMILCILPENQKNFLNDITELVEKYSV